VGATIDLIEALRPECVIPGHGSPFAGAARIATAIERARSRLASFVAEPRRHASHAIKVLIKFKLLEWQSVEFDHFAHWAEQLPYTREVHSRYFPGLNLHEWLELLTAELAKSGALGREGSIIYNI